MSYGSEVGQIILQQLGGGQFRAMTGAKDFLWMSAGGVFFTLPKMSGIKVNRVQVMLDANDTYTVSFFAKRGEKLEALKVFDNVYAEDLRGIFEGATGLRTSLTAVYA